MRPVDIYALPSTETVAWHEETWGRFRHLFEDGDMLSAEVDVEAAKAAGDAPLLFETKLEAHSDHDRGARYTAVTFEGRPVAILIGFGRGMDDHLRRFVTDAAGYRAARAYVEGFLHQYAETAKERVEPEDDIPELAGVYGHRVVVGPSGPQLVPESYLDAEGRPILDHAAFRGAIERILMPAVRGKGPEGRVPAIEQRSPQGLALTAQAILESLGEDVVATADFERVPRAAGVHRKLAWEGVLAASGDATYLVGITSYGQAGYLGWTSSLDVERVGGRDLYDALAHEAAPIPRP